MESEEGERDERDGMEGDMEGEMRCKGRYGRRLKEGGGRVGDKGGGGRWEERTTEPRKKRKRKGKGE